jgi:hypothetical protein
MEHMEARDKKRENDGTHGSERGGSAGGRNEVTSTRRYSTTKNKQGAYRCLAWDTWAMQQDR